MLTPYPAAGERETRTPAEAELPHCAQLPVTASIKRYQGRPRTDLLLARFRCAYGQMNELRGVINSGHPFMLLALRTGVAPQTTPDALSPESLRSGWANRA